MNRLRAVGRGLVVLALSATTAAPALATPSTTLWTPMTPDIQARGVLHIGIDNYFTAFRKSRDGGGAFPTDAGLTLGVLPYEKIQMEVGVDLLESSDDPLYFNAKVGAPEGALFGGSPAIALGLFDAGTKKDVTNLDIAHVVVGKTIPGVGRLSAGPYVGNGRALVDAVGRKENAGFMLGIDRGFLPVAGDGGPRFDRVVVAADFASGKNAFGGGGIGANYFFHDDVSLLTGPVWFNEDAINGKWKWTIQLDVNRTLFGP